MVILPNFPPPNFPAIRYCVSFELLLNQNFSPLCATFGETAHFDIIILIQPTFLLYALIKPHNLFTPLATSHNTLCDQWAGSKHGQTVLTITYHIWDQNLIVLQIKAIQILIHS